MTQCIRTGWTGRLTLWLGLLLALFAMLAPVAGCADKDDGTAPSAEDGELPELKLTDETPELLLTWFDERGRTHTGVSLSEVPEGSNKMVRVITRDAGHGGLFYVADLSAKRPDGTYPVRTMPRSDWEAALAKVRADYRAKHAPPQASALPSAPHPPGSATPTTKVGAIVYGASWCKPCHQAAAYLKKRGVRVVERDIEKQPRYGKEMHRKLKRAGKRGSSIPVIDVDGIILQGYSRTALDRAIKRARGGTHL